jgi:hypothetical protein
MNASSRALLAGAGILLAVVAGCSTVVESDLPTTGEAGETGTAVALVDLEAAASAMYECAGEAGVTVQYQNIDGRPILIRFPAGSKVVQFFDDGSAVSIGDFSQAEFDAAEQAVIRGLEQSDQSPGTPGSTPSRAGLVVDGVDHSVAWRACLASSQYDEQRAQQAAAASPAMTAYHELVVAASNEWADCARGHGFPDVRDARLGPEGQGAPMALLPSGVAEDQLRRLLEQCPNFDPELEEANAALWQKVVDEGELDPYAYPDGYRAQPNVGIDYPGFDGTSGPPPDDPATLDRLAKLQSILLTGAAEYYGQASDGSGGVAASEGPA